MTMPRNEIDHHSYSEDVLADWELFRNIDLEPELNELSLFHIFGYVFAQNRRIAELMPAQFNGVCFLVSRSALAKVSDQRCIDSLERKRCAVVRLVEAEGSGVLQLTEMHPARQRRVLALVIELATFGIDLHIRVRGGSGGDTHLKSSLENFRKTFKAL